MSTLLAYASAREMAAFPDSPLDTLELGVGKVAAAMTLAATFAQSKPEAVLLAGIAGAFPQAHLRAGLRELEVGATVMVGTEVAADEGVLTPTGFVDLATLGLEVPEPLAADPELTAKLAEFLDCPVVPGATVSTGAGIDALSQAHALRSGAQVESMEGAAVAAVCRRFGVPFVELRVISNKTGDRDRGAWDLEGSTAALAKALTEIVLADLLP